MNILQIAGGQTWPNLLPILGYQPEVVTFLTSSDPGKVFEASIDSMAKAAQRAGHPVSVKRLVTTGQQPTLKQCLKALSSLAPATIDLVNITGGSKTMSLAAYQFAKDHGIPSFYLDTRRSEAFEDLGTAPQTRPFPDLAEISSRIDVPTALLAQGFAIPNSFKCPTEAQRRFARQAAEIRADEDASKEIAAGLAHLRNHLTDPKNGRLLRKGKLRAALTRAIITVPDSPWFRYLAAAANEGIIEQCDPPNEFLITRSDPTAADTSDLSSETDHNFKLLEGIWFEIAVFDLLSARRSFTDVCWSVEADRDIDPTASSRGETDLVAFHGKSLNLHFISCKTTGPHGTPLDHIQGLRRRATKEGGQYAKAELWIFRPKSESHRRDLENHCNAQNVTLRIFTEVSSPKTP